MGIFFVSILKKKIARPLHLGRNRGLSRGPGLRTAWLGLIEYQIRPGATVLSPASEGSKNT